MNALVDVTWIRQAENIAYAPLKIIHLTDSTILPLSISNCKMSNKWGKSTSVCNDLRRRFADRFLESLFDYSGLMLMMSRTRTDAVTSLSVFHHLPGSSRVHLCSRPQGTEGLSALSLRVSTINLSVTYIQFSLDLIELRWTCFPRVPQVWLVLKGWLGSQGSPDSQAHQDLENQAYQ